MDPGLEEAESPPDDEGKLLVPTEIEPPAPPSDRWATWRLGLTLAAAYSLNYFWRYPIFMLPSDTLNKPVATVFGTRLKLQACFSIAFTLGFGAAKVPAVYVMSSSLFFSRRLECCIGLFALTMSTVGLGVWGFQAVPALQVLAVFVSCFFASWVYGGMITYIEGRRSTGNISRGTASLVLDMGVSPPLMPLVIGLVACPVACVLIWLVSRMPGPSAADIASRSKRRAMTSEQRVAFIKEWWPGIVLMLISYATMTGIRSFRDFYVKQIFSAAMNKSKDDVPSWAYFVADAPGAVLSCLALGLANRVRDHVTALRALFTVQIIAVLFALGATVLFKLDAIGGLLWQMMLGAGIFVSYTLMQTPVFERLFAATHTEGTCAFLIFLSDFCGYVATIGLLLYNTFGGSSGDSDDDNKDVLDLYLSVLWAGGLSIVAALAGCLAYFMFRLRNPYAPTELEHSDMDHASSSKDSEA